MKRIIPIFVLLFLFPVVSFAQDLQQVERGIERERLQAQRTEKEARLRIERERRELTSRLSVLKKEIAGLKAEIERLKGQFLELQKKEERLQLEQAQSRQEMKELAGVVRAAAKDLEEIFAHSLTSAEVEGRFEKLGLLLNERRFPAFEEIKGLVDMCFEEMRLSRQVVKRRGRFISPEGEWVEGIILRAGKFTAYWMREGEVGLLRYGKENRGLLALSGHLPWAVKRNVKKYMEGKTDCLYLDPSGGAALRYVIRRPNLYEHLRSGGPIVIPILLIGAVAAVLLIERALFFMKTRPLGDEMAKELITLAEGGQWQRCEGLLKEAKGTPVANVLLEGLSARGKTQEVVEATFDEAILKEGIRLTRFLAALKVLAAVAPLLGLLGTVTGIINTFRAITVYGTGDPRMMSGGISEALVTTQVGLAVAIPIMFFYTYFESKAEKVMSEMEEKAALLLPFLKGGDGTSR